MIRETKFQVMHGGKIKVEEPEVVELAGVEYAPAPAAPALGIFRIQEMIQDPTVAVSEISRLIASEIAETLKLQLAPDPLSPAYVSSRDLNDRIKSYRELQKTLTEGESLSKRDSLNLDGEKFQYVFEQLMRMYQQVLVEAKLDEGTVHNIMLHFGDLVKQSEAQLRIDVNKIGTRRQ
jgi:hypothetical protein